MIVVRFFPCGVTERGNLSGAHLLHEHINFKANFKKDGCKLMFSRVVLPSVGHSDELHINASRLRKMMFKSRLLRGN